MKLRINRLVSQDNDMIAAVIRQMLDEQGIRSVNIMGAPGSGKTTLIEGLSQYLEGVAVIQGDLESDIDKQRLSRAGIQAHQINTHSGCHLNANMVAGALQDMELSGVRYILIENVGNLVCPTGVDIGQHKNIVISSTTEGADKPAKYPIIFREAGLVVISKHDLAGAVDFDEGQYMQQLALLTDAAVARVRKDRPESYRGVAEFVEKN